MSFPVKVKRLALDRQSKNDGYGSWCAGCGTSIERKKKIDVPRIPFNKGGRKNASNCVILCADCYGALTEDGAPRITPESVPYLKNAPPNWEAEKRKY